MEEIDRINRLLIILTDSFPRNLEQNWFSKLAYLGTHTRQGLWAELFSPTYKSKEKLWSLFSTGADELEKRARFWDMVNRNGKSGIIFSEIEPLKHFHNTQEKNLYQLLKQEDWSLFITAIPKTIEDRDTPSDSLEWDKFHQLDREIETVALAAGPKTSIMIISFPAPEQTGWLILGGPKIASIGNPGPVDLMDLPPTILWLLGIDVPPYMPGQILEEILDSGSDLTQEEMDILADHLRGLGYLG
jgi:hypothetical protein